MKKVVFFVLAGMLLCSPLCFAADPISNLKQGESRIGVSYGHADYSRPGYEDGYTNYTGYFFKTGVANNLTMGISYSSNTATKHVRKGEGTNVWAEYYLIPNIYVLVENSHNISSGNNTFVYGITGKANLGKQTDCYAGFAKGERQTEYKVGFVHALRPNIMLNVGYVHDTWGDTTRNSIGGSISYKF